MCITFDSLQKKYYKLSLREAEAERKTARALELEVMSNAFSDNLTEYALINFQARRLRREENLKPREENIKKSDIVQNIKNLEEKKRISKKELRKVRKV